MNTTMKGAHVPCVLTAATHVNATTVAPPHKIPWLSVAAPKADVPLQASEHHDQHLRAPQATVGATSRVTPTSTGQSQARETECEMHLIMASGAISPVHCHMPQNDVT